MKKTNIFLFAAGLGKRLRPITDHIPKPLLPLLGKPVLQRLLENLSALPFEKIGINIHYKKEAIEQWTAGSLLHDRIRLFPEEKIMGTGGALKEAAALLREGTFLVHNADILTDINLLNLLEHHLSSGNTATLAVHDFPEFNKLVIDENGFLMGIEERQPGPLQGGRISAFTGIAFYEPGFLEFLPACPSSVVDAWLRALSSGCRIGTFNVSGCRWADIGTPAAYASAVFDALRAEGETIYVHPSIKECSDPDLHGYVVIEEGCRIEKGVSLKNCILLPAGHAQRDTQYKDCIIGPGLRVPLYDSSTRDCDGEKEGRPIGAGGSDREYYRVIRENKSAVLMQSSGNAPDFERHIEYTHFFLKHSIPVPGLIEADHERMQAVFEDAGDTSLYSYLKYPRQGRVIKDIYRKVMQAMAMIHSIGAGDIRESSLLTERVFDYAHFRWETDYFMTRFVEGIMDRGAEDPAALKEEFHQLAKKADSFPKTVIHRDLQSQNIMIMEGREIRIIDFQGARTGPPAYDAASILWDPYYCLDERLRERLLVYYMEEMSGTGKGFSRESFIGTLLTCRLQRHMQALGAYGFLSSVKGKGYFLKYVPEGLRLLKEDVSLSGHEYPELYRLVMKLHR